MTFSDSDSPKFCFNVADVSGGIDIDIVDIIDFGTTNLAVLVDVGVGTTNLAVLIDTSDVVGGGIGDVAVLVNTT